MRHRVVWTYGVPPDPNALIRMPTWDVVTAIGGIETLRQVGSLGEANFKAAKSLTAWEYRKSDYQRLSSTLLFSSEILLKKTK